MGKFVIREVKTGFKFKKDENAGIAKMSRVQFGGTGKPAQRNNLVFKVNGSGALTLIGRSSGDAARNLTVEVNGVPVNEEGFEMPGKAENAKTVSIAVEAKDGDLIPLLHEMGPRRYS